MHLFNWIRADGEHRLGVRLSSGFVDATALLGSTVPALSITCTDDLAACPESTGRLRAMLDSTAAEAYFFAPEEIHRWAPCIGRPEKIICIGLNYRRHVLESRLPIPEQPVVFSKFNNALAAHEETVLLPATAEEYDYEVELGVIIGRAGRDIDEREALSHVFGYCSVNDLSARDLQMRTSQWLLGKSLDGFMPIGPYLVTADRVPDPQNLQLKCWVNGDLRQSSNTGDMIFPVAGLISHVSRCMTLKPGDIISTGTPEGVAYGMKHPVWIRSGDSVSVEISGLGLLTNSFRTLPTPMKVDTA